MQRLDLKMLVLASAMASVVEPVHAETTRTFTCNKESIKATFNTTLSSYFVEALCFMTERNDDGTVTHQAHWNSSGSFDPRTTLAHELVTLRATNGTTASFLTSLYCPSDPWLGPSMGAGTVICTDARYNAKGDVMPMHYWLEWLQFGFLGTTTGFRLPNSTGFQYNRTALIAQRDADLKAEAAAALAKTNKRIQQGVKKGPAVVAPTIQLPAPGARFLSMTSVPIKIAPPQGLTVTMYMVKIERKDSQGIWTSPTNIIPIGLAEASSPSGYLGWGTGGSGGRSQAFMALPGTYRVSAQVSSPREGVWGPPVEFTVTAPPSKSQAQKAPKMFGQ